MPENSWDAAETKDSKLAAEKTDALSLSNLLSGSRDKSKRTFSEKVIDSVSIFSNLPSQACRQGVKHLQEKPAELGTQILTGVAIGASLAAVSKNPGILGKALTGAVLNTAERSAPLFAGMAALDWGMRVGTPMYDAYSTGNVMSAKHRLAQNVGEGCTTYAAGAIGGALGTAIGLKAPLKSLENTATALRIRLDRGDFSQELKLPFEHATRLNAEPGLSMSEFSSKSTSLYNERVVVAAIEPGRPAELHNAAIAKVGQSGKVYDHGYACWLVELDSGAKAAFSVSELRPEIVRPGFSLDPRAKFIASDKPLNLKPGDTVLRVDHSLEAINLLDSPTSGYILGRPVGTTGGGVYFDGHSLNMPGKFSIVNSSEAAIRAQPGQKIKLNVDFKGAVAGEYEILKINGLGRPGSVIGDRFTVSAKSSQATQIEGRGGTFGHPERFNFTNAELTERRFVQLKPIQLEKGDTIAIPDSYYSPVPGDWQFKSMQKTSWQVRSASENGVVVQNENNLVKIPRSHLREPYVYKLDELQARSPNFYKAPLMPTGQIFASSIAGGAMAAWSINSYDRLTATR